MSILISQLIVVLINTYIAFTERKKNIYIVTFLFNFANLVMYLFNNDKTTAVIYVVISVRSLVYIFKDIIINKLGRLSIAVPILCIVVQLLVGFTQIESLWQLIPILTPCAMAATGANTTVLAEATSMAVTTALAPIRHQLIVSRLRL